MDRNDGAVESPPEVAMHFVEVSREELHHSLGKRIAEYNEPPRRARVARDEMHLVNLGLSLGRQRPLGREGDILIVKTPGREENARGHVAPAVTGGKELVFIKGLNFGVPRQHGSDFLHDGNVAIVRAEIIPMGIGFVVEPHRSMCELCFTHDWSGIDDYLARDGANLPHQHVETARRYPRRHVGQKLAVDILLVRRNQDGARYVARHQLLMDRSQLSIDAFDLPWLET